MDILHKILKYVSYNRYTVGGILTVATAVCLTACTTGRVTDGTTGEQVSIKQAVTNYNNQLADLESEFVSNNATISTLMNRNEQIQEEAELLDERYSDTWIQAEEQQNKLNALVEWGVNLAGPALAAIGLTPTTVVTGLGLLGGTFGVGSQLDSRRKNKVIKTLKEQA